MLFRPEEVHRASGIRGIFKPFPIGYCHIGHYPFWFGSEDFPVSDLHPYGKPAIKTGSIDLNCFSWK